MLWYDAALRVERFGQDCTAMLHRGFYDVLRCEARLRIRQCEGKTSGNALNA